MTYLISPVINKRELKAKKVIGSKRAYKFLESVLQQNDLQVEKIIKRNGSKEFVCSQFGTRIFVKKIQQ